MSIDVSYLRTFAYRQLASAALPIRRCIFWALWHQSWIFSGKKSTGFAPIFRYLLSTPHAKLPILERRFSFFQHASYLELMAVLERSTPGLLGDIRYTKIRNGEVLERLAHDNSPVIFAPLHMGANVFGMMALIHTYFRGRPVLIFRKDAVDEETQIYERIRDIGSDVKSVFVDNKASFVDALKFARKNAVVICFCDLPASFGSPANVELIGKTARMAMGIEGLSRALLAPIIPLTCYSRLLREIIVVGTPFEVMSASLSDRARVAARIARHVTEAIRLVPEQWELWSIIDRYIDELNDNDTIDTAAVTPSGTHRYDAIPA